MSIMLDKTIINNGVQKCYNVSEKYVDISGSDSAH